MALDGDWNLVIQSPMGPQEARLNVKTKSTTAFDGFMSVLSNEDTFEGAIEGDTLVWQMEITTPVMLKIGFSVAVAGDGMTGMANLGKFGEGAVTGARA